MAKVQIDGPFRRGQARATSVAGFAIIALAAGAALLPAEKGISSDVLGGLLLAAGLIEMVAGALRRETRTLAMGAGGITAVAGLLFLLNSDARFFPTVNIVIAWLFVRAIVLGVTSMQVESGVRRWTMIAAGTDFALALIMMIGLSLSTAVVLIFGPTPEIVASFAWVLALSFVATGTLLLEVASCEREATS
jgi:hypothetical protein